MDSIRDAFRQQGLVRPREGRVLAGVCAGLARRFGISPGIARLLFVLILLVLPGSQILVYPLLWFLMPDEDVTTPWGTPGPPAA
jgi:phage shock protein PspC (stress-responsive transcriptional regulator)